MTNFPTSLDSYSSDSPAGFGQVVDLFRTTMTASHSIGATTLNVADTTNAPSAGHLILSEITNTIVPEVVTYTGKTGTTFTGVSALTKNWAGGDRVSIGPVAANHNVIAQAAVAIETKIGTGSSTPAADTVLRGTGTGTSAFGQVVNADISSSAGIVQTKLASFDRARVRSNANQSISDITWTAISFQVEDSDTNALHDTVTNNSRLTCVTAGTYLIVGSVSWASNSTGVRYLRVRLNGSSNIATENRNAVNGDTTNIHISTLYSLSASDYLELQGYQSSGGSLNCLNEGANAPFFFMVRLP